MLVDNSIRSLPLEETEQNQVPPECKETEDGGSGKRGVAIDTSCTNEHVINDGILVDCNCSAARERRVMDSDDFTYSVLYAEMWIPTLSFALVT